MTVYDLVIKRGRVMDPASGFEGVYNVGVKEGKMHTLTKDDIKGAQEIDASGLVVAPGFIDIHTHADGVVGAGKFMATIGVTTAIGGNCGSFMALEKEEREALLESKEDMMGALQSKEDLGALFARIDQEGYPVNLGMLIGNAALRYWVGAEDRGAPASEAQIAKMEQLAEVAMAQGAMGVSFGLAYVPGTSSQELRSLFRVAARHGGIASIHPRYHALGFPGFAQDAVAGEEELIEAARATGVKLQIGHIAHQIAFKAKPYDALVKRGLETIERARADGVDVTADCLPIAYFGAAVSESFLDMLVSPAFEDVYGVRIEDAADIESGPYKGQRLTRELFFRLRQEAPNTALRGLLIKEDLMIRTLIPPYVMVSNDAGEGGVPAQPLVLGKMVRELGVLTMMEALYKMTAQPARRLGLTEKGRVAVGADADLVIFDPTTVAGVECRGKDPEWEVKGIQYVVVNGVPIVAAGELLEGVNPGKALRHQSYLARAGQPLSGTE